MNTVAPTLEEVMDVIARHDAVSTITYRHEEAGRAATALRILKDLRNERLSGVWTPGLPSDQTSSDDLDATILALENGVHAAFSRSCVETVEGCGTDQFAGSRTLCATQADAQAVATKLWTELSADRTRFCAAGALWLRMHRECSRHAVDGLYRFACEATASGWRPSTIAHGAAPSWILEVGIHGLVVAIPLEDRICLKHDRWSAEFSTASVPRSEMLFRAVPMLLEGSMEFETALRGGEFA